MHFALDFPFVRTAARAAFALLAGLTLGVPPPADALGTATAPYLLVGTGDADIAGTTVAVSNFEIGLNLETVPMPGLTLVEPIPPGTRPFPLGVTGDGEIAITDPGGRLDFANLSIRGDLGVRCAALAATCLDGVSNTTFNGLPFPDNGFTSGVSFAEILAELDVARALIPTLSRDVLLTFPGGDWATNRQILLPAGLSVIDIDTGGNDLLLQNGNLVIDGPAGALAIFRVPRDANFLVSQAAILLGDGGIEPGSVLFHSDKPDTDAHFSFSSAAVNGVAFWDLGRSAGEVSFDNVQGCTQVIGDKLSLSDVRLTRCAFTVPEPGEGALAAAVAATLGGVVARRRRRTVSLVPDSFGPRERERAMPGSTDSDSLSNVA